MMIRATGPSGIGLLPASWTFTAPLLLGGAVTMATLGYLLWLLRARRLTPGRLAGTAAFYGVFDGALAFTW